MNFPAIGYGCRRVKALFADKFQIKRVPSLLLFGPKPPSGGDRPLLNSDARCLIERSAVSPQQLSCRLADFPYCFLPPRYMDLNHMTDSLDAVSCVVVFCHGCDNEEQELIQSALKGAATLAAEKCLIPRGNAADWRFLWSCLRTPFSDTLQDAIRLDQRRRLQEEPLMLLLDIPDNGAFYICESEEDITRNSILDFVKNPGKRHQM